MTQVCISVIVGVFFNTLQLQNTTVNSLIATTSRERPPPLSDHFENNRFVSQSNHCLKNSIVNDHYLNFVSTATTF